MYVPDGRPSVRSADVYRTGLGRCEREGGKREKPEMPLYGILVRCCIVDAHGRVKVLDSEKDYVCTMSVSC
jgi:hypothetical protein